MRLVKPKRLAPSALRSSGSTSPCMCGSWIAQARKNAPERLCSKVAARFGLPSTRMSASTTCGSILSAASAAAFSHSTRFEVGASWCARYAACAFFTAASTAAASASTMSATTRSSIGDTSGAVAAFGESLACPPIHGSTRNLSLMGSSGNGRGATRNASQQRFRRFWQAAGAGRKVRLRGPALLDADTRGLDHLGPFRSLGAGERREGVRRHRRRLAAHVRKRRHHLRLAEDVLHLAGDLVDDRARRAAWRIERLPARRPQPPPRPAHPPPPRPTPPPLP